MTRSAPKNPRLITPLLVGIVGGSGAGKTWLAHQLKKKLGPKNVAAVSLDDFYRDRSHLPTARRNRINFDNPKAIDWPALERAADLWRRGKTATIPQYDFATHSRKAITKSVAPRSVILIDGLWLFWRRALRNKFALRVFIECGVHCRLERRIARDCRQRGRTENSVKQQFLRTVQPMHAKFVAPQKHWANVILPGNFRSGQIAHLTRLIREAVHPG